MELPTDHPPSAQLQLLLKERKATEEGLKKTGKEFAARNPPAIYQAGEGRAAQGQPLRASSGVKARGCRAALPARAGCAQPEVAETSPTRAWGRGSRARWTFGLSTPSPVRPLLPGRATLWRALLRTQCHPHSPGSYSPAFFPGSRDAPPQTRDPLGASSRPSAKSQRLYFSSSLFPS